MKALYFFLLIILSCLLVKCTPIRSDSLSYYPKANNSNRTGSMPNEPGKCYAKCLIPNKYQKQGIHYYEYTGDDANNPNVVKEEIVIKQSSTSWIKKKADKNCLSKNPDDCLVWCLIENPKEFYSVNVVIDTNIVKDFQLIDTSVLILVEEGGFNDWRAVKCQNEITPDFISQLQEALSTNSYFIGPKSGILDQLTKDALLSYQKDNYLPVGQLDEETLETLGLQ